MIDPLGQLINEAVDAGLASGRVRGGEAAPGDLQGPPGPNGEPSFQRCIVLSNLGGSRWHRAPLQRVRIAARCYGATSQDAHALWGALSDLVDNAGGRITSGGRAIYQSLDDAGGDDQFDPVTHQPYTAGVIELIAATEVVTV